MKKMKDVKQPVVNAYRDKLLFKLYKYLKKKGKKFVNDNYYEIQTFTKLLLNNELLQFVLQKGTTYNYNPKNVESPKPIENYDLIQERIIKYLAQNKEVIPISHRDYILFFIIHNGDIVATFDYYFSRLKRDRIESSTTEKEIYDYPDQKIQIQIERSSVLRPQTLVFRIYKNTSLNNLSKLLNRKDVIGVIKSLRQLPSFINYPYGKQGKVDYYQKIITYLASVEKNKAKAKNAPIKQKVRKDINKAADFDSELLPDTDEQIAAKALDNEKYYKLDNVKKGANRIRAIRKRLVGSFNSSK